MALDLGEKDRRYNLIREKMHSELLDALIVINSAQINEKGFVKYLTNYRSVLYNLVVVFPLKGDPRILVPSPVQKYWARVLGWISHVEDQVPSIEESLSRTIREMGLAKGRLGLINSKIMPAQLYLALKNNFPDAAIVEATSIIEETRMVKSSQELDSVRATAALADLSFKALTEVLRPGITERQIIADVDRQLVSQGAEDIFHLFSSKPGNLFPYLPSEREVQMGDVIILNTELSGPGGYWVQMIRTSFVGKPKSDVAKMYDTLIGLTSSLSSQLRPGRRAGEVAEWVRQQIIDAGFEVGVNFGHGLGLDVVERPLIHVKETTELKPGMVITVHPQLVSEDKRASVWLGDTYLISEGGAETLTKVDPAEIKVLV